MRDLMTSISNAVNGDLIHADLLADILSVSKSTISKWEQSGKLVPIHKNGASFYDIRQLTSFPVINSMLTSEWELELKTRPIKPFTSIELFAGAGGLAIGLEKAGLHAVLLNEWDKQACNTLRTNRPNWNVLEGDVSHIDFTKFRGVDFLAGGFPCQAFSYAGKQLGFEDARGTLFLNLQERLRNTTQSFYW